jgi:hypothetical protein
MHPVVLLNVDYGISACIVAFEVLLHISIVDDNERDYQLVYKDRIIDMKCSIVRNGLKNGAIMTAVMKSAWQLNVPMDC